MHYVEVELTAADVNVKKIVGNKFKPYPNTMVSMVFKDADGKPIDVPILTANSNNIGIDIYPYRDSNYSVFVAGQQQNTTTIWKQGRPIANERHVDALSIKEWPTTPDVATIILRVTQY